MNRTQVSAVFFIAATIMFSVNLNEPFAFISWLITSILFSYSAWNDKK